MISKLNYSALLEKTNSPFNYQPQHLKLQQIDSVGTLLPAEKSEKLDNSLIDMLNKLLAHLIEGRAKIT